MADRKLETTESFVKWLAEEIARGSKDKWQLHYRTNRERTDVIEEARPFTDEDRKDYWHDEGDEIPETINDRYVDTWTEKKKVYGIEIELEWHYAFKIEWAYEQVETWALETSGGSGYRSSSTSVEIPAVVGEALHTQWKKDAYYSYRDDSHEYAGYVLAKTVMTRLKKAGVGADYKDLIAQAETAKKAAEEKKAASDQRHRRRAVYKDAMQVVGMLQDEAKDKPHRNGYKVYQSAEEFFGMVAKAWNWAESYDHDAAGFSSKAPDEFYADMEAEYGDTEAE